MYWIDLYPALIQQTPHYCTLLDGTRARLRNTSLLVIFLFNLKFIPTAWSDPDGRISGTLLTLEIYLLRPQSHNSPSWTTQRNIHKTNVGYW